LDSPTPGLLFHAWYANLVACFCFMLALLIRA
jgi:hypothetical protein